MTRTKDATAKEAWLATTTEQVVTFFARHPEAFELWVADGLIPEFSPGLSDIELVAGVIRAAKSSIERDGSGDSSGARLPSGEPLRPKDLWPSANAMLEDLFPQPRGRLE